MIKYADKKYFKMSVKVKKETDNDISCNCPVCGDTKGRCHLYDSGHDIALVYCYNSGCELSERAAPVGKFLHMIGSPYLGAYKRATLQDNVENIKSSMSIEDVLRAAKKEPPKTNEPEIPLHHFKKIQDSPEAMEYLNKRKITPGNWFFSDEKFYSIEIDGVKKTLYLLNFILIPITNNGKYKGFYSRSIEEKRFSTYLMEDVEKIWTNTNKIDIVTEGIFDALSTGYENCAAMLGAGLSKEYRKTLSKDTIFAFDNDKTGKRKALEYVDYGFNVFCWPQIEEKDFNEMLINGKSKEEIKQMIETNTYKGIQAKTRLLMS